MPADAGAAGPQTMSLSEWDPGDEIPPEHFGRMLAHPAFPAAARALAASSLRTTQGDSAMRDIGKDAGRYTAALCAIWLDLDGGLTLPRLKDLCARSGLLSPGRARSFLQFLEHVGFLEMTRPGRAAAAALYAPTPRFRQVWLDHLRGPIAAAALIAPEAHALLDRLDEPEVAATFLKLQGAGLLAATPQVDGSLGPLFDAFYYPLGAIHILSNLVAAGEDGDAFPPHEATPLSISGMAGRLGVSRVHVKRIVANATAAVLLEPRGPGAYALTGQTDAPLKAIYAFQLIRLLIPIARTLRHCGAIKNVQL